MISNLNLSVLADFGLSTVRLRSTYMLTPLSSTTLVGPFTHASRQGSVLFPKLCHHEVDAGSEIGEQLLVFAHCSELIGEYRHLRSNFG